MASKSENGNSSSAEIKTENEGATTTEPLRILMLAANPIDKNKLALKKEYRLLRRKMLPNIEAGSCDLRREWATTAEDLQDALTAFKPHIVHFSGHGTDGCICLEDEERKSHPLSKRELGLLLNMAKSWLRVIVLNACCSGQQVDNLVQLVDFIVGTKVPVVDSAALQFTNDFYRTIAIGGTVREAFKKAQENTTQRNVYELSVRPGADETTPLLPPKFRSKTVLKASERIKAGTFNLAQEILEGQDASLINRMPYPDEQSIVLAETPIAEANVVNVARRIVRRGKN